MTLKKRSCSPTTASPAGGGFGPAVPTLCIGALPILLAAGLCWLPGHAVDLLHEQGKRRVQSMQEAAIRSTSRALLEGLESKPSEPWIARVDGWNCSVQKRSGPKGSMHSDWLMTDVAEPGTQRLGLQNLGFSSERPCGEGLGLEGGVSPQGHAQYCFPWLAGSAPAAFAEPFLHLVPGEKHAGWPTLDVEAVQRGVATSAALPWLIDAGTLANAHISGGTDLRDWQFADRQDSRVRLSEILGDARHGVVLAVDGNLWIDGGGEPLVVETDHAVTVVVRGNVWMLDSLLVRGSGHLTLVVLAAAPTLESARPVEGVGRLTIETPRQAEDEPFREDAVPRCDANLVIDGSMSVAGGGICCRGSLLLRGRLDANSGVPFTANGELVLDPTKDAVPGFVVTGPPRPGRVRSVDRAAPALR